MKMRLLLAAIVIACTMPSSVHAHALAPLQDAKPSSADTAPVPTQPVDQLVTMTVHEAWVASGRNEDKFLSMVQQLAELSAQKRGIALPETRDAGAKAGEWIKKEARRDPDQLLFVVVDRAVRHVGKMQAEATATPAAK